MGAGGSTASTSAPGALRRPKLKAGLTRLQRDPTSVQFGLDPARAVVLSGIDPPLTACLDLLDGSLRPEAVARALNIPCERVHGLLRLLASAGLLEDGPGAPEGWGDLPPSDRDRLVPDLASLTQVLPGPDAGRTAFARRLAATVEVRGGGRVGASLASLLAAAGIGQVRVVDDATTTPADLSPGGLQDADLGLPRATAATARAGRPRAAAPKPRGTDAPGQPDLVVFADHLPAPGAGDDLVAAGIPHLVATLRDTEGLVGPLVVPGHSSCLHCQHLARADRDRAWPRVAAQLAVGPRGTVQAGDVVLASAVAAHAALQVLAFLDTGTTSTIDGTLHVLLPGGAVRRRSWRRHHACGCTWAAPAAG